MRSIRVKGELKSLPEEHAAWFFTASCGQGPTVCSTLAIGSSSTSSVDVPFSSPSLSEGELTLQLRALRSEEDTARGEAGVLIASRKVVMATSKSTLTTELRLKPSAGDLLETKASFALEWLPSVSHAAALSSQWLAVAVSATFSHGALREDLSLRVLDAEGTCLAAGCLAASAHEEKGGWVGAPLLLLLSEQHRGKALDLSVAGQGAGVFCVPLQLGEPLVTRIGVEAEGAAPGGCLLLNTVLRLHPGAGAGAGPAQLLSFGPVTLMSFPITSENKEKDEEKDKDKEEGPPSVLLLYHLECLSVGQAGGPVAAQHDPAHAASVVARVVRGPLLSRMDLPPPSTSSSSSAQAGTGPGLFMLAPHPPARPTSSSQEQEQELDVAVMQREFEAQPPSRLLHSQQHLSAARPLAVRLSILAVQVQEGQEGEPAPLPCAQLVGCCLLTEAHRSSFSEQKEASNLLPDSEFVVLRGTVEEAGAGAGPAGAALRAGDVVQLACALLPLDVSPTPTDKKPDDVVRREQQQPAEVEEQQHQSQQVQNEAEGGLLSLHASRTALLEPALASQHSSTKSLLNELGRILQQEGAGAAGASTSEQRRLVDALSHELGEKQRLVERLLGECSDGARTIAEQTARGDKLRGEICRLQVELAHSRAALSHREEESSAAVRLAEDGADSPASLQQFSRPVLVQAVIECGRRLKLAELRILDLQKVMGDADSTRKQLAVQSRKHSALQEAHLQQSKHLQKMQKQHEKVKTYQNTIVMQEKVISKMQALIEAHLRSSASRASASQHVSAMSASLPSKHSGGLKNGLSSNDDRKIDSRGARGEQQRDHLSQERAGDSDGTTAVSVAAADTIARLRAEVASKDIRVEALQEQLALSAAEASREIASLRTRLFEFEIAGHGSSVSGGDDLGLARSFSLERSLQLPLHQSLQEENRQLRQEVLSARSRSSAASSQQGPGGGVEFPALVRDPPDSRGRFVDLSGTTHREDPSLPLRSSASSSSQAAAAAAVSLAEAYRLASSRGGSARPVSPSEQSTARSSTHYSQQSRHTGHQSEPQPPPLSSTRSGRSSRRSSEDGGEREREELLRELHLEGSSKARSRVSSAEHAGGAAGAALQGLLLGGEEGRASKANKAEASSRGALLEF